jgi:SNF2 family DNA or RNA helicase
MTAIHAALTGSRQELILMAAGEYAEDVALAAKRLQTLTPLFRKSDPPGALVAPLTWPLLVQLEATFRGGHLGTLVKHPDVQAWIDEQIAARTMSGADPITYEPPTGLTPYPWQIAGADMIAATGGALITDEPGTGKTITAILGLVERASITGQDGPALVICPASVIDSWVGAWQTWAPHVRTVAWRGPKRSELLGTADVYVTSYDLAWRDAPAAGTKAMRPLVELSAAHVVIDECHLIKNHGTNRSKAVRRLAKKAETVVALSGTPITHHPGDLWAALDAMNHDAWPAKERWVHRYCEVVPGEDYTETVLGLHPGTEPEFRLTLLGQHRRVAKADVLTQLPPKVYSVRTVDLPEKWRKVYDDFEEQMLAELPDGQELRVMDVMSKFTHLSGLSSAAADVEVTMGPDVDEQTGELKRHVHLELKAPSWKVDALLEILEERPGQPVVAFAPSRQLVQLAGVAAEAKGLRVGYIVGGQSAGERTKAVNAFQAGELDLICVTTGAGGVGITLTAARTCVFLQRPWSIVEAVQAEDRCHRIGSEIHDSVEVIDIVARHTIDSRVRAVLRERAGQLADLVQDPRIVAELLGGSRATQTERKAS